jgi:starvation-inducible DNA-binding protein
MQTYIQISDPDREALVGILHGHLAATLQLYLLGKMAHWNLRGPEFIGLHELFDEVAEGLRKQADTLAERAAALGGYVRSDAGSIAETTFLEPFDEDLRDGLELSDELASRLGERAIALRDALRDVRDHEDPATEHLLAEILAETEKQVWMLEAHLQTVVDVEEGEEDETAPVDTTSPDA